MPALSENARGALLMSAGMAGFVANDAIMKALSDSFAPPQAVFLRGLFVTLLLAALAWRQGVLAPGHLPAGDRWRILARSVAELLATLTFLTALFNMPIANASAILQLLPLTITLAAALFLGAPIGWRRCAAIGVGLLGVWLIIRPGAEGFNIHALWALAAVVMVTARDLVTRTLNRVTPSLLVSLAASILVTLSAGAMAVLEPWAPVNAADLAWLASAGVFVVVGYLCGVMAMRTGDIGVVSPFRYTIMLWALLLGALVFDEVPDETSLFGTALIVVAGGYSFHRERVRRTGGAIITSRRM